ncbi:MAG: T9SS type A sorting domain-containing protein [Ignavibacteriales bacterium]|nr:T9SS type A sorting domain-containing protein [Ignavibacteriales bacterium]
MKNIFIRGAFALFALLSLTDTAYSQVDLYLDSLNVYVTKYGKLLLYSMPDTVRQLYRSSVLVGTGIGAVMDERADIDFEDTTKLLSNPSFGDFEIYGSYNNNYTALPPNALVKQTIYCWQHQSSFIVKYTVINRETAPINAVFGLELIPALEGASAGTDTFTYNRQTKIFSNRKSVSLGYKLLSGEINTLNAFLYTGTYFNSDTTFWNYLTNGEIDTLFITDPNDPAVEDPVIIPSFASRTLASGDSTTYYVAYAFGLNYQKMLYNMHLAQQKYDLLTAVTPEGNNTPRSYMLEQNYPNPFNPSTKITYQLPEASNVKLTVYDMLGKEITTLVNGQQPAGKHVIDFNAAGLPSGVYFYTINSGSFFEAREMMLIK